MLKNNLLLLVLLLVTSACQSTRTVQPFSWPQNAFVASAQFKHMMLSRNDTHSGQRLHVYIEGDGRPFRNRFQVSDDPSPPVPMMLKLMEQDAHASLYLGRPCYFASSAPAMADSQCDSRYWTLARYSDEVVASMVSVLRQYLTNHPARGITLIGHSGGGTLAMLMAARMNEVDQVVTLAGNLDTQAWSRLHIYTPLKDSLNPADLRGLSVQQLHYGGEKDDNIPPALSEAFLTRIGQTMHIIKDADHNCCWLGHWGELLKQVDLQMNP